jgi:hypothetical protein
MKTIIRLEEFAKLAGCFIASTYLGYPWWLFWALLLLPDLSMIGYLINTRAGAFLYNLVHHRGVAIIIGFAGFLYQSTPTIMMALILFGHSSMDRMFGYGLKYADSFQHTHLGRIGKK